MNENTSPPKKADKPWDQVSPKRRIRFWRIVLAVFSVSAIVVALIWFYCFRMPGESFVKASNLGVRSAQSAGNSESSSSTDANQQFSKSESDSDATLPNESVENVNLSQPKEPTQVLSVADELKKYVTHLAVTIGERNLRHHDELCEAADYIEKQFTDWGYQPKRQTYQLRGLDCYNIDVEIKGTKSPEEIVIIGGHYDSVEGTPGANDNGSGTAAMLVLANHFKKSKPDRTLRFVAWTNEEPPYFQHRGAMGSWVYAEKCRKEDQNIVAVLSLETMGYFTDNADSQKYPAPLNLLYPSTGNFIGFVSNLNSGQLQRRVIKTFRENAKIPSEGASLPNAMPGVGWSDHWSFWQEGYVGLMVTDTAPFRYPHYHEASDTPDKINFPEMAKVVDGLVFVVEDLVKSESEEKK
jgi:hypothetical protein